MPKTIYLDTQDYINLFNEPLDGPNHRVLANLLDYRDRGHILIGFSFVTIIEFITKPDVENRSERVRRGQLIKDVCGPNAFPNITDLAKGATFPNGGRWIFTPDEKVVSASKFKQQMHSSLIKELAKAEGLNRGQRRKYGRRATMSDLIRKNGSSWGRKRADYAGLPVSNEIIESRLLERFMKGQCSDAEFESRMNDWLSDPAEYSRIVYDYGDHPNVIEKYFSKSIDDIEQLANQMQDIAASVKEINAKLLSERSRLQKSGLDKKELRRLTRQISMPEPSIEKLDTKLETIVGVGRAKHFSHYLKRIMKLGYVFKRSDVMDLMQMCYAYDCDLFRCDKDMANTFRDFQPFEGKLVSRFSDLPGRIESQLLA